jgi:hypothetical protein
MTKFSLVSVGFFIGAAATIEATIKTNRDIGVGCTVLGGLLICPLGLRCLNLYMARAMTLVYWAMSGDQGAALGGEIGFARSPDQ